MSPLPSRMVNRWENRPDPLPGQEMLYWHILLRDHPTFQEAALIGQQRLAPFPGLHFTPREWLHITTLVLGSYAEFRPADIQSMVKRAADILSDIPPVTVRIDRIIYHPEAIVLKVDPSDALDHVREAVKTATGKPVTRKDSVYEPSWNPHVTLAYSTAVQETAPIVLALGRQVPACEVTIDRISLVAQKGPERNWDWHSLAIVSLGGTTRRRESNAQDSSA